eukprot:5001143-Prymnesium_polylepis.1
MAFASCSSTPPERSLSASVSSSSVATLTARMAASSLIGRIPLNSAPATIPETSSDEIHLEAVHSSWRELATRSTSERCAPYMPQ